MKMGKCVSLHTIWNLELLIAMTGSSHEKALKLQNDSMLPYKRSEKFQNCCTLAKLVISSEMQRTVKILSRELLWSSKTEF